jgi:hypothetical protein
MNTNLAGKILKVIGNAHRFADGLDCSGQSSIQKDYIRRMLPELRIEDINTTLFELRERGRVDFDFNKDCNIIYVT